MTLENERRALEEQRRTLERERLEFTRRVEIEDRRLEQQQKLFEMKFKILEEELVKLASEKEHVQRQRDFYQKVNEYEARHAHRQKASTNNVLRSIIRIIWMEIKKQFRKSTVNIISYVRFIRYSTQKTGEVFSCLLCCSDLLVF